MLFSLCSTWLFFLVLTLGFHSTRWLYLGYLAYLAFSLYILFFSFTTLRNFRIVRPFPTLSLLGEEYVGSMFCLFLEAVPQGQFQEALDQSCMDAFLQDAHSKLDTYFGKSHVCRLERDRFVVVKEFDLSSDGDFEQRNAFLDRVANYVSLMLSDLTHPADKQALRVSPLTIGAAASGIRYQAHSVDDLIELAYFTMKIAQTEKRRYLVSDETIRARKLNNDECLQGFLKKGWEDEFAPFFQPIVDSDTFKIVGMESFARWQLGRVRILDAKVFKDLAQEMGRIERIDTVIIENTFDMVEKLQKDALIPSDFKIVINISASTLHSLSAQELVDMAEQYGIEAHNIELDINGDAFSNHMITRDILEFKNRSMKLALDVFSQEAFDLGGFFNNRYDTIKLDYSQPQDEELITGYDNHFYASLVGIASEFDIEVLAKGIENQSQFRAAKNHGVHYLQGNYFTPPIPYFSFQIFIKKYQDGLFLDEYNLA